MGHEYEDADHLAPDARISIRGFPRWLQDHRIVEELRNCRVRTMNWMMGLGMSKVRTTQLRKGLGGIGCGFFYGFNQANGDYHLFGPLLWANGQPDWEQFCIYYTWPTGPIHVWQMATFSQSIGTCLHVSAAAYLVCYCKPGQRLNIHKAVSTRFMDFNQYTI
ncbi:hypothetical protein BDV25DRAFT_47909 [Aspergillus avenaceus]|uniref:Uncharacterized protein n=1 Tax=Aspergillus avenaceus TaxID=36643 RepID=A0A5N6U304_ASPAV|nr:hypothetical protein BDV25DRAFT_47909 [Aspergillus avenaceus]